MSKIKITAKPINLGRWQIFHDGAPFEIVSELPHYFRPVSEAKQAERKQAKQAKTAEDAQQGYERRSKAKDFDEVRKKMIERAGEDEDLLQQLSTEHDAFNRAHDAIRLEALEEAHRAKIEKLKERQHQRGNFLDRDKADDDIMAAHEAFHAERARIESGDYESKAEEE